MQENDASFTQFANSVAQHLSPLNKGAHNKIWSINWRGYPALLRQTRSVDKHWDRGMVPEALAMERARTEVKVPNIKFVQEPWLVMDHIVGKPVGTQDLLWYEPMVRGCMKFHHLPLLAGESEDLGLWHRWLHAWLRDVESKVTPHSKAFLVSLGVPTLDTLLNGVQSPLLDDRSRFLHGDLHNENILVDTFQQLWFIDWELSAVGDSTWEAATSLVKIHWPDPEAFHWAWDLWVRMMPQRKDAHRSLRYHYTVQSWRMAVAGAVCMSYNDNPSWGELAALAQHLRGIGLQHTPEEVSVVLQRSRNVTLQTSAA